MKNMVMAAVLVMGFVGSGLASEEKSVRVALGEIPNASIVNPSEFPCKEPGYLHNVLNGSISYFRPQVEVDSGVLTYFKSLVRLAGQCLEPDDIVSAESITVFICLGELYLIVKNAGQSCIAFRFKRDGGYDNNLSALESATGVRLHSHTKERSHLEYVAILVAQAKAHDGSDVA